MPGARVRQEHADAPGQPDARELKATALNVLGAAMLRENLVKGAKGQVARLACNLKNHEVGEAD